MIKDNEWLIEVDSDSDSNHVAGSSLSTLLMMMIGERLCERHAKSAGARENLY